MHFKCYMFVMLIFLKSNYKQEILFFVWFDVLRRIQQLWSCRDETTNSPNHTFFLSKVNQYFAHKLTATLLESVEGGEWSQKLFYDQASRKYGTGPGSNSVPLALQSDSLPTALQGSVINGKENKTALLKNNYLISQPKHMLWVLEITLISDVHEHVPSLIYQIKYHYCFFPNKNICWGYSNN